MTIKNITVAASADKTPNLAAKLVQEASKYDSRIYIEEANLKINVKSIMGMMSLNIAGGQNLTVTADGDDEEKALDAIAEYLNKAS